ncbi:fimbrial protein [Aeromonas simiae]|uniref:fimbrial protein n=1 Tax=Aeromonas simiae TaxID=218936 RepID=UPI0038CFC492
MSKGVQLQSFERGEVVKMKKGVPLLCLGIGIATVVNADHFSPSEGGFTGVITDVACSINPGSSDQEVDLGQMAVHQLEHHGTSTPRHFEMALENCTQATKSAVRVAFGGAAADSSHQLLGITGSAVGAGVAITDGAGHTVTLGESFAARELMEGNNRLMFWAYLVTADVIMTH